MKQHTWSPWKPTKNTSCSTRSHKMPLFRSKFQPKKCPPRKTSNVSNLRRNMDALQLEREFSIQIEKVRLDLGDRQQFEFNCDNGGKWISISPPNTKTKSNTTIQKLEEKNNWLKLQSDLLLNMVSKTYHRENCIHNHLLSFCS